MSGRILIVDSLPTNRVLLKAKLDAAYFDVQATGNAAEAVLLARHDQPDLILLSTGLANHEGLMVCKMLKSARETRHIPIILISGDASADALKGFTAGADDVLIRPYDDFTLKTRVRNLIRMKRMLDELGLRDDTARDLELETGISHSTGFAEGNEKNTVLLMPRNASEASSWSRHLRETGVNPVIAWSEKDAMERISQGGIQVCVIHKQATKNCDGLRMISNLHSQTATQYLGLVYVCEAGDVESAAQAIDLGASDFITLPINLGELAGRVRCQLRRKQVSDELRANLRNGIRASFVDPLTRLYNRRYAEKHLARMVRRAHEEKQSFAVMMMDLDHFKNVNDQYGHFTGDEVLKETANRLASSLRNVDLLARFGGEEFFIAMPDASMDGAAQVAERVRSAIEGTPFLTGSGRVLNITISIGVAMADPAHETPINDMLEQADKALYACKAAGRNCVRFHQQAA